MKRGTVRRGGPWGAGAGILALALACASPRCACARIEILLMGQTVGLKPPPIEPGIRFRGTPFGHMALYIESATRDPDRVIRQCREGEEGGLVLTVDKELADGFFAANGRREFFYGPLDPSRLPASVSRAEIERALEGFDRDYGLLYRKGPGISGFGQDYGTLCIRRIWGFVYPTTREEEAAIIRFWQEHRRDSFVPMTNNCVTTVLGALRHAGLERRSFFIRGLSPYNAWNRIVGELLWARPSETAPNGNYLRRAGSYLAVYPQIPSDAVWMSGRPFNVYSLLNLEYTLWRGPRASFPLPSGEPVSFRGYPSGKEIFEGEADGVPAPPGAASSFLRWAASQPEEFLRLWWQSCRGLWFLAAR